MTDMIVSGAGGEGAGVNGIYYENGTRDGAPRYTGPNDINNYGGISRYDGIWEISPDFELGPIYISVESGLATPDLVTTWTIYGIPEEFWEYFLPFPTVTAAGGSSQNLTLTCAAGSYTLTGTNADLTVKRNYVLNLAYPDIIVSGAGTPVEYVNGTYILSGIEEGRPWYLISSYGVIIKWNVPYWAIAIEDGDAFYSTDNVATPDLVTTWLDGGFGAASLPTVTATNSYKLSGTDATLTVQRNYTLVCEPGSYTLTGTDITFGNSKAYSLTCEAGAYTLIGSSVSFVIQRNYSLACETGSYTLTGTDATLTKTTGAQSYTLVCSAGSYSLTGTNAGLTSARTMALASGSYALTGTNADFYRSLVMACNAGSYALTGSDATFNANYVFALGMGSYVLVGTSVGLFILTPTPACRTVAIPHENRTAIIEYENRTLEVTCH